MTDLTDEAIRAAGAGGSTDSAAVAAPHPMDAWLRRKAGHAGAGVPARPAPAEEPGPTRATGDAGGGPRGRAMPGRRSVDDWIHAEFDRQRYGGSGKL